MTTDYDRIERAIRFLAANHRRQPTLPEVAHHAGLSEFHFQRLFSRWAGISPKRFLQFLTADHARRLLRDSRSLLDVTLETGLSSQGRLHDLFVAVDAVTPGEFKDAGAGLAIRYAFHASPFGGSLIGVTDRGVCWLSFVAGGGRRAAIAAMRGHWPGATLEEAPRAVDTVARRIFGSRDRHAATPLPLFVKGTNFQIKIWEALLRVPAGEVTTYDRVASVVGAPRAARAVGLNPISFVIPCHRVIRASGALGDYRWGAGRKRAILLWEAAHEQAVTAAARQAS